MKQVRQFLRHHRFTHKQDPHREYELYKEAWRINHPDATPAEYERAMQEIARKLGL